MNIFKTCCDNIESEQRKKNQKIEDEAFEKELYDLILGMKRRGSVDCRRTRIRFHYSNQKES